RRVGGRVLREIGAMKGGPRQYCAAARHQRPVVLFRHTGVTRRPLRPAKFVALAALLQAKLFMLRVLPEHLGIGVHGTDRTWCGHASGSFGVDEAFALTCAIVHVLRHLSPLPLARA